MPRRKSSSTSLQTHEFQRVLVSICWPSFGEPRLLSLKEILEHFIDHRRDVTLRRCRYELRKAEARAHILEGFKIALDFIDEVIAIIRGSATAEEARLGLMTRFNCEKQASAILENATSAIDSSAR